MSDKRPAKDEYNWDVYTQEYSRQAEEAAASGHQGSDALVKKSHATIVSPLPEPIKGH